MRCSKKSVVFFMVLLLVCSSVWAFPSVKQTAKAEPKVEVVVVTAPEVPLVQEEKPQESSPVPVPAPSPVISESRQDETLKKLSEKLESYDKARKLDKSEVVSLLEGIQADYEIIVKDAEAKEVQITKLAEANAKQADDIAYLQGRYDKEKNGCKFFANVNATLGYDEGFIYGVGGNIGVRWGKGFLTTIGGSYDLGKIGEPIVIDDFKKSSCHAVVGFGWEW